jgi:hypothetical protein
LAGVDKVDDISPDLLHFFSLPQNHSTSLTPYLSLTTSRLIIANMSSSIAPEFEAANEKYAASFNKGHLPLPPGR